MGDVDANISNTPNISKITIIGNNHHFLFLIKKLTNSLMINSFSTVTVIAQILADNPH